MKKSRMLMIAITVLATSCSTLSQLATSGGDQKFQDGIYSNAPDFRSKTEKEESRAETEALIAKTKESPVYLFGDRKDTIMIPDNYAATIKYDGKPEGTTVILWENPYDWRININPWAYYTPYSIGSSWWWSRHYDPWYWNTWSYTPWRYHSWYDPFYTGGWYDPWYYGGFGWYDSWYYGGYCGWHYPWHHHHYSGWYGGFGPHWGHNHHPGYMPGHINRPTKDIHYGPRHETEIKDRMVTGRKQTPTTVRRGVGTSSSTSRGTIGSRSSGPRQNSSGTVKSNGRKPSSYRRPSTSSGSVSSGREGSNSQGRGTVNRESPSSYERNNSSYNRSSSSSRSSGYSGGSGGSYNRGSSYGGGSRSAGGARR